MQPNIAIKVTGSVVRILIQTTDAVTFIAIFGCIQKLKI